MTSPVIFTLGKYEIIGLLGEGGIAVVYKGYHREIDRFVAVKVLRPHYSRDEQFVERFKLEARVIARLQHPHIVPLYDYGSEGDVWYLAQAYIQGGSLADLIAAGPMSLRQIDKVLREIASALDYAHRNGVIHRDIKPSNILIDAEGHALLADFGIVKIAGSGSTLTGTGGILGTPAYISPEQAQARQVDGRADIYSLGVVVFEMLTGQQPFPSRTPVEALVNHINAPVPSVTQIRPDLPPALEFPIQRVMAKFPVERYQTAVEFFEDFSRVVHSDQSFAQIKRGLRPQLETVEHAPVRLADDTPSVPLPTIVLEDSPQRRLLPRGLKLMVLAALMGIAVILGSLKIGTTTSLGSLTFSTASAPGDTARLDAQGLSPLPAGEHYAAWLLNAGGGTAVALGSLTLDGSGSGSLTYADSDGRVLLSLGDALVITAENDDAVSNPGIVRYSGHVSTGLSDILTEILVRSSELPAEAATPAATYGPAAKPLNSLLDGALIEATMGEMHSGLAAAAPNDGALHIHAEHTLNIYLGTRDDYNGNGRGENPGRKIGVPFFLDKIDELLNAAISAPNTPASAQADMRGILVCDQNIRVWMNRILELEHDLLVAADITAVEPQKTESTSLASAIMDGTDLNQNGQIEPIAGECGLQQVSDYALRMASMTIVSEPPA